MDLLVDSREVIQNEIFVCDTEFSVKVTAVLEVICNLVSHSSVWYIFSSVGVSHGVSREFPQSYSQLSEVHLRSVRSASAALCPHWPKWCFQQVSTHRGRQRLMGQPGLLLSMLLGKTEWEPLDSACPYCLFRYTSFSCPMDTKITLACGRTLSTDIKVLFSNSYIKAFVNCPQLWFVLCLEWKL